MAIHQTAGAMSRKCFLGQLALAGIASVWGGEPRDGAQSPRARAAAALDALLKAFRVEATGGFRRHRNRDKPLDFWFSAHLWDMLIDANRLFRTAHTRRLVTSFYDAFCKRHPDWRKNEYNDDILWWTIACTNAYRHTHERRYLEQAQRNFDWLLEHEVDDVLGGGMWWKNREHKSKNACNNFPAVITACNLYGIVKDRRYRQAAERLFAWSRERFFDVKSGAVYDNVDVSGKLTRWDFTYNVGTFIGSALRLQRLTGKQSYLEDALKAGRHFMRDLSRDGIVKPCGKGDGGAFHGVGFRYLMELAATAGGSEVRAYCRRNAESAWEHRRRDGLVGPDWRTVPADDFDLECQVANSAVTLLMLVALSDGSR